MQVYVGKKRVLQSFLAGVKAADARPMYLAYGAGLFGSTMCGCMSAPTVWLVKQVLAFFGADRVVAVHEYCTSKMDFWSQTQLHSVETLDLVTKHKVPVRGLKVTRTAKVHQRAKIHRRPIQKKATISRKAMKATHQSKTPAPPTCSPAKKTKKPRTAGTIGKPRDKSLNLVNRDGGAALSMAFAASCSERPPYLRREYAGSKLRDQPYELRKRTHEVRKRRR